MPCLPSAGEPSNPARPYLPGKVRYRHISQGTGKKFYWPITLTKFCQRLSCSLPTETLSLCQPTPERHTPENPMPNQVADEILESYCTDSRVHALINDPTTEGIDEG